MLRCPHVRVYAHTTILVLNWTATYLKLGCVSVRRHRNDDLYVVRCAAAFELTLGLDHVLDAAVRVLFDDRLDPDQRLHLYVS